MPDSPNPPLHPMLPTRDAELVQIVDFALAEATQRSLRPDGTSWLFCHPGCTPCCHGVFRISPLDAARLRAGLTNLRQQEPARAEVLLDRARTLVTTLAPEFPGDPVSGFLAPDNPDGDDPEPTAFDLFADLPAADAACPVLDPATSRCELYASRPLTCRIFGPPVQNEGGVGHCELCYVGAPEAAILQGEMHLTHHDLEAELTAELPPGDTVIAWAVLQP